MLPLSLNNYAFSSLVRLWTKLAHLVPEPHTHAHTSSPCVVASPDFFVPVRSHHVLRTIFLSWTTGELLWMNKVMRCKTEEVWLWQNAENCISCATFYDAPFFLEVCRLAPEHLTQLLVDYLFFWMVRFAVWIGPKNCLPNSGWWNLLTTVNAAWFSWLPTCRRFHNFKLPSWFLGAFSLNFPQDYYFKDYNNKLKPIKFKFIFAFLAGENCLFASQAINFA